VKKNLLLALKIVVTVLLTVLILYQADWRAIATGLQQISLLNLLLVLLAMTACVSLSAWKWSLLLRIHGATFAFKVLHKWYFIAMFFNNFLPTSIGGDGYRIYRTLDNKRSRTAAVLAIFTERLSGILTLLLVGWFAALIGSVIHGGLLSKTYVRLGVIGLVIAGASLLLLLNRRFWQRLLHWKKLPKLLHTLTEHLVDYRQQPGRSAAVIGVSLLFHLFTISWFWLLMKTAGEPLAWYDVAVISALLSVVAVVPLSINGIGVIEGSLIYLAAQFGMSYDTALLVALLQRVLLIPISLAGGLLYLLERGHRPGSPQAASDLPGSAH